MFLTRFYVREKKQLAKSHSCQPYKAWERYKLFVLSYRTRAWVADLSNDNNQIASE